MKELLIILVSSAIVHNVVLSQFLGLCPFFGVSKKTETAVLGVALTNVQDEYNIFQGTINGFATAVGFTISITLMAGIREKIQYNDIPDAFKGFPTVLLTAGLMAIAFFGFSGLI